MLDAVLGHLAPLCEGLGVPIVVADNASSDATPAVCARHAAGHAGVRFERHSREVSLDESVMSALALSAADYTWLCWDDSWLLPQGLAHVLGVLGGGSPSAVLAATTSVRPGSAVDPGAPVAPQIAHLVERARREGTCHFTHAGDLFRARFYGLPIPSVIYPTAAVLGADHRRYHGTFHPHIGALYDVLAGEEASRGQVDVAEILDVCSVSLTPLGERGKQSWTAHFDDIGRRALPAWFELLPQLYQPDVPAALAHHRHIFRAAFQPPRGGLDAVMPTDRSRSVIEADVAEIGERAGADLAFFDGKTVLVTGGAGFLPAYLVDVLAARAAAQPEATRGRVVVVDNFATGLPGRLSHLEGHPAVEIRRADVSQPLSLDVAPRIVVHGASIASPIVYRRHPLETIEVNAIGTWRLLAATAGQRLDAFVLLSSSEVYGDPDPAFIPTPETYAGSVSCTGPRACYDESKRLAETLCMTHFRTRGLPVRIVRPFNVYGPGLRLDDGRVLPDLARAALEGSDLALLSDGRPTRSFCYVTDFMVGLLRVVAGGGDGEAYNVGNDHEISIRELAEGVLRAAGGKSSITFLRSSDPDYLTDNPQRRCPDLTRLRGLGAPPAVVGLDEGVARYLAWARTSGELDRVVEQGGSPA
jgi:UDP-glucuronate decarboxylase